MDTNDGINNKMWECTICVNFFHTCTQNTANIILSELQIVEKQLNSVYMIDACVAKLSNYKNITNLKKKELTLLGVIVLKHRATI